MEDKIRRFDDVYKLALTLVALAIAFGSRFNENFVEEASFLLGFYLVAFLGWSIGHLIEDVQLEVCFKLAGCMGFLLDFLPVLMNLVVPPWHMVSVAVLWLAYLTYWLCYRYLRQYLRLRVARYLLQLAPLVVFIYLTGYIIV